MQSTGRSSEEAEQKRYKAQEKNLALVRRKDCSFTDVGEREDRMGTGEGRFIKL